MPLVAESILFHPEEDDENKARPWGSMFWPREEVLTQPERDIFI